MAEEKNQKNEDKIEAGAEDNQSHDETLADEKSTAGKLANTSVGVEDLADKKSFEHNLMEAIASEETADKSFDGKVAKQRKAGYTLNGRVLEAAKVVVYKL